MLREAGYEIKKLTADYFLMKRDDDRAFVPREGEIDGKLWKDFLKKAGKLAVIFTLAGLLSAPRPEGFASSRYSPAPTLHSRRAEFRPPSAGAPAPARSFAPE